MMLLHILQYKSIVQLIRSRAMQMPMRCRSNMSRIYVCVLGKKERNKNIKSIAIFVLNSFFHSFMYTCMNLYSFVIFYIHFSLSKAIVFALSLMLHLICSLFFSFVSSHSIIFFYHCLSQRPIKTTNKQKTVLYLLFSLTHNKRRQRRQRK